MTLGELYDRLKVEIERGRGSRNVRDYKIVIREKSMHTAVGGSPHINVTRYYFGFDWDDGLFFLHTEEPVRRAGAGFERARNYARQMSEQLGWIWMILRNKDYTAEMKVRAIQSHYNKRKRKK